MQDQNRYNAGRGGHINLRRAEKARIIISKIPGTKHLKSCIILTFYTIYLTEEINSFSGMVDNLISRTFAWEDDRNKIFLYDGVS